MAEPQAVALAEELGAQLGRMKGAGPKLGQFLSMVGPARGAAAFGALPPNATTVPFGRVRRVIEQDLDAGLRDLFADVDEEPFAVASLGQVHRARTTDGDDVAVKVQHAGVAEGVEADLRTLGLLGPILGRLAPRVDARAVLAEIRERISDELDHEVEAQQQRRLERRFRGHPHVRVPRVHTDVCARRVLVTEYVEGLPADAIGRLGDAERDRVGEIAFRFFLGLAWRDGTVAGDPHPDNCVLCPDGRLCVLDFGLMRDLDPDYLRGEREILRAAATGDAAGVHAGAVALGYLPEPRTFDADALLELVTLGGAWLLTPGFRRLAPEDAADTLDRAYPPRSPGFESMRRMTVPPATLLLRRVELQLLFLLGSFRAGADWGAIAAEHHSDAPVTTALGREDRAFFAR